MGAEQATLNPYVFLVGCPRSGTTLLRRMIDAHPLIAVLGETRWIHCFFQSRTGVTSDGHVERALVTALLEDRHFQKMQIGREQLEALLGSGRAVTYSQFVAGLFDLYGQARGKSLVGDKTPGYVREMELLHDLWPGARFVHLVRDGRNVCLSMLDWDKRKRFVGRFITWEEDPVSTVALWWKWSIQRWRDAGRPLGASLYHELHYEALVTQPAAECASLCAFLGVPYEAAMLRFHEGRTRTEAGLDAKSAWLPITPGLRDWRTQMAPEAVERFEAVAGDLLEELGYERACLRVSVAVTDRAARITECFNREIAERSNEPAQASNSMRFSERRAPARAVLDNKREQRLAMTAERGTVVHWTMGAGQATLNPYVFLVGCPRSGTTLLRRIVDAHPLVAVTRETHWIPCFFQSRTGLTSDGHVQPALVTALLEDRHFQKMRIGREQLEALLGSGHAVTYSRFVAGLFDLYGQACGKSLVGDKTPGYVREMELLHDLWPGARFVHLVRDGRDVCLSVLDWEKGKRIVGWFGTEGEDPTSTVALWWRWTVRLGREAGERLGPRRCLELKYEALMTAPAEECARLCAFLDVPYEAAMLRFHEGRTRTEAGRDAKSAWLPITPGLRDWKAQMTSEAIERFEAAAGDLLDELGYPRAVPRPSASALKYAAWLRDQFTSEALARGWQRPERW